MRVGQGIYIYIYICIYIYIYIIVKLYIYIYMMVFDREIKRVKQGLIGLPVAYIVGVY